MKIYQVIVQDEWNNLYDLGFTRSLNSKDTLERINSYMPNGYRIKPGMIKEYASTFGMCFDTCVADLVMDDEDVFFKEEDDLEDYYGIYIRGFIYDTEKLKECISEVEEEVRLC